MNISVFKLKKDVTEKTLIEKGFTIKNFPAHGKVAVRPDSIAEKSIYIILEESHKQKNCIGYRFGHTRNENFSDLLSDIQDIIEIGETEV